MKRSAQSALLLAVVFVAACGDPGPQKTVELTVKNMDCQNCVAKVAGMLEDVDGVTKVKVDLKTERATCRVGEKVDPKALAAAITGGFEASVYGGQ